MRTVVQDAKVISVLRLVVGVAILVVVLIATWVFWTLAFIALPYGVALGLMLIAVIAWHKRKRQRLAAQDR